jgi:hypothetical protein
VPATAVNYISQRVSLRRHGAQGGKRRAAGRAGYARRWVHRRSDMNRLARTLIVLVLLPGSALADQSVKEMEARAKASLARDSAYEKQSVRAFYFEVLPDGSLGSTLFEPETPVAKCIKSHTAQRTFPKPPGAYVTKIEMSFKPWADKTGDETLR